MCLLSCYFRLCFHHSTDFFVVVVVFLGVCGDLPTPPPPGREGTFSDPPLDKLKASEPLDLPVITGTFMLRRTMYLSYFFFFNKINYY